MKLSLVLALFTLIMENNIYLMDLKATFFQHGIKRQTTIPYNPQQNGVVERMNRTLPNMVCSMMFSRMKN
jgi:transposase InsO family protein